MDLGGATKKSGRKTREEPATAGYKLDQFFNITPDLLCIADRAGYLVELNSAWEAALGYRHSDLRGKQLADLVHPDDRTAVIERLALRTASMPGPGASVHRFRHADGSYRWLEWHSSRKENKIYWAGRDSTERKAAEERLHESEARWRQLFDELPDALLLLDDTSGIPVIADCNAALCAVTGYSQDELIGEPIMKLRPPEVTEEDVRKRARIVREAGHLTFEIEYLRKDGSRFPIEAAVATIRMDGRDMSLVVERDISARRAAETALRESEERFAEFMDRVPALCFVKDSDSRLVYLNRQFRDTHDAEDWLGKTDAELWSLEEARRLSRIDHLVLELGEQVRVEEDFPVRDRLHSFLTAKFPMHGPSGRRLVGGVSIDITDQKRAERALRESEARWKQLFDSSPDGLLLLDDSADVPVIVDCNPAICVTSGYAREELVGQPILRLTAPAITADDAHVRLEQVHHAGTTAFETEYRRKDGSLDPVEVSATAIHMDGRKMTLAVERDISIRRTAEQALRESEGRFRAAIEALPVAVVGYDGERLVLANQAATMLSGFAIEEILGEGFLERVLDAESLDMLLARRDARTRGEPTADHYELRLTRSDGQRRIFEASTALVWLGGRPVSYVAASDVTDRTRYEDELRHLNEELEERVSQRTAALAEAKERAEAADRAKSTLLSRASHELRTPLNSILGFAQLLALDDLSADQQESVERILDGGSHLLGLVDEILDLARIETGRLALSLEPTDLTTLVHEAIDIVGPMARERGITLDSQWGASQGPWVDADRQRLKQVLLNFLSNAIKYNSENGAVIVRTAEDGDRTVRLAVTDTGAGIAHDKLGLLFNPFERLGAEATGVQGTGLGLALSRALTEAMGGRIGVESRPGAGSTFWVDLATADRPAMAEPAGAKGRGAGLAAPPDRPRRVLYIEDNLENLRLVESLLKRWRDVTLIPAMQGRVGLDLAAEQADLIVLDVHLPDLTGEEVLRQLKANPSTREIPVIIASADATPEQASRMIDAGALHYFTKPLDVREFLATLSQILGGTAATSTTL